MIAVSRLPDNPVVSLRTDLLPIGVSVRSQRRSELRSWCDMQVLGTTTRGASPVVTAGLA